MTEKDAFDPVNTACRRRRKSGRDWSGATAIEGGVPQTNSPSCQSRNASRATPGVQANIMPRNTACKVVIAFAPSTLPLLRISDSDACRLLARPPLQTTQRYYFCISRRTMTDCCDA
jgi:hypothetical protein